MAQCLGLVIMDSASFSHCLGIRGRQPLFPSPSLKGAISKSVRNTGFLKPEHPVHTASIALPCRRFPRLACRTVGTMVITSILVDAGRSRWSLEHKQPVHALSGCP